MVGGLGAAAAEAVSASALATRAETKRIRREFNWMNGIEEQKKLRFAHASPSYITTKSPMSASMASLLAARRLALTCSALGFRQSQLHGRNSVFIEFSIDF